MNEKLRDVEERNQASTGSGGHIYGRRGAPFYEQLYKRKQHLESELREVNEAIKILETDQTVQNMLRVFEAAAKP